MAVHSRQAGRFSCRPLGIDTRRGDLMDCAASSCEHDGPLIAIAIGANDFHGRRGHVDSSCLVLAGAHRDFARIGFPHNTRCPASLREAVRYRCQAEMPGARRIQMDRLPTRSAVVLASALAVTGVLAVVPAPQAAAYPAAPPILGDFSGLVDIGGRSLYLECRGQGSPTVILEAGARRPRRRLEPGQSAAVRRADHGPARRGRVHPRLRL